MVLFCELCGKVLIPVQKTNNSRKNQQMTLSCSGCGKGMNVDDLNGHYTVNTTLGNGAERRTVVINSTGTGQQLPVMSRECPKCSNGDAYYSETRDNRVEEYERVLVYSCIRCSHVFR